MTLIEFASRSALTAENHERGQCAVDLFPWACLAVFRHDGNKPLPPFPSPDAAPAFVILGLRVSGTILQRLVAKGIKIPWAAIGQWNKRNPLYRLPLNTSYTNHTETLSTTAILRIGFCSGISFWNRQKSLTNRLWRSFFTV